MADEHTDRDAYVDALLPHAQRLVGAVRDGNPAAVVEVLDGVRGVPAPDGVDPVAALAVVLACLVPDLSSPRELLAWHWAVRR
ncbi:MAG TPA: hypothetical protein VIS06_15310 [Mycobacteriales bacterium]